MSILSLFVPTVCRCVGVDDLYNRRFIGVPIVYKYFIISYIIYYVADNRFCKEVESVKMECLCSLSYSTTVHQVEQK